MKNFILTAVAAIFASFSTAAFAEGDPTTGFSADDSVMNAAIEEALETFPQFLENVLDENGFAAPSASIKVALAVTAGGDTANEVIWVGPFMVRQDGMLAGNLSNQPRFLEGLNIGDPVRFPQSLVRDWAYWDGTGMGYGNYTTRVIAKQMGAQGKPLLDRLHDDPIPADWK